MSCFDTSFRTSLNVALHQVPWDGPWDAMPDARNFCRELLTFAVPRGASLEAVLSAPDVFRALFLSRRNAVHISRAFPLQAQHFLL